MKVKESLNVIFDETPPPPKTSPLEDDDLVEEEAIEFNKTRPLGLGHNLARVVPALAPQGQVCNLERIGPE
nr:hypothetical protein CTI12_AA182560 [Tanacetum cinerariifolium]